MAEYYLDRDDMERHFKECSREAGKIIIRNQKDKALEYGRKLDRELMRVKKRGTPSQLNSTQRKKIDRLEKLLKEAKLITAALVVNGYTRWLNDELKEAITRFNRKVK